MDSQSEVVCKMSAQVTDDLAICDDNTNDGTNDDMSEEAIERLLTEDHGPNDQTCDEVVTEVNVQKHVFGTNRAENVVNIVEVTKEVTISEDKQVINSIPEEEVVIDLDEKTNDEPEVVGESVIGNTNTDNTDEVIEEEVTEVITQAIKMSTEDETPMEVIDISNEDSNPKNKEEVSREETFEASDKEQKPLTISEDNNDSDLIIRGLKTSLMLSEERNQKTEREKNKLEEELKKVYQHLFKSMDEKKTLQIKCQTLEEQIEKLVSNTAGHKRPAQESHQQMVKPTPSKKSQQNNHDKKVRFRRSDPGSDHRPHFGQFGDRFRENHITPPPFPGPNAPEFLPPQMSYGPPRDPPMNAFRSPSLLSSPDIPDLVLTDGFQMISTVGNRLQLPASIVERTVRLFRQCYDSPLRTMCRNNTHAMATACVFIACREDHCPQTFKTLCTVSKLDRQELDQCLSNIVRAFNIDMEQTTPGELIGEYCARSGFSRLIQTAAIQIVKKSQLLNLIPPGSAPNAAAAAVLLASMASDDQRPVFEIAYLTGVSDNAIRQNYNRMLPKARQLFPPNFPFITSPEALPHM